MSTMQRRSPAPPASSGDDYVALCATVRSLCGVDLLQYKRAQMERRLRALARRRDAQDLHGYARLVRRDPAALEELLDRMTINVSQLWRNPEQWQVLARDVLVDLGHAGRIRAWSAGCSYGAEAYTLAAVASEAVPAARLEVRGTDIDRRMIERAREGRFSADDARSAPPHALRRWFERDGEGWRANSKLRGLCHWEVGDLLRMRVSPASFDLVLCRNTVIYFTDDVRDDLHARLAAALRPGGYLLIGSTERVGHPPELRLEPVAPFTYRRLAS